MVPGALKVLSAYAVNPGFLGGHVLQNIYTSVIDCILFQESLQANFELTKYMAPRFRCDAIKSRLHIIMYVCSKA